MALSQNSLTTALIVLKIYKQHQVSTSHGIVDRTSKLSLIRILRIIIESAMLYTIQLTILIILYYTNNNAKVIVQYAIVPSVGEWFHRSIPLDIIRSLNINRHRIHPDVASGERSQIKFALCHWTRYNTKLACARRRGQPQRHIPITRRCQFQDITERPFG